MAFFVPLLIAIAVNVVAYLLTPKPKKQQPPEVEDLSDPTAEAGRPVPVIFGTVTTKGLNICWYGGKMSRNLRIPKD
jgi:hypothetical protein